MAITLTPGDIAFVGFNFDNPDVFAFVAMVDIPAGTQITFTDNGWKADGTFRANEGSFTWTAPSLIAAGTVVAPVVSGVAFSTGGDQILAYQGDAAAPVFIAAINSEGSPGAWQADATSSNTSALPSGLVEGQTALALDEIDNAIYTGPTSGTRETLLAAINDGGNWTGDNSTPQILPSGSFTVTDGSGPAPAPAGAESLTATVVSRTPVPGSEILAYDPDTKTAFVTSGAGVQVVDYSDPDLPVVGAPITFESLSLPNDVTSVSVFGNLVAAAVPASPETDPGSVVFFRTDGTLLGAVEVGALPDMVTFSPDGTRVLVANEGEADGGVDPAGSVSVITVDAADPAASMVATISFTGLSGQEDALRAAGVRIFPEADASVDLEPEYITVVGPTAYIALQEANAFAIISDITAVADGSSFAASDIVTAGTVDHSVLGNGIDASDRDGAINIQTHPVTGLRMPDGFGAFEVGGVRYFASANEGEARDEDERIKNITLDPTAFPDAATLQQDENIGRLQVSTIDGDTDGDGDFDALFSYGTRSFTIFDANGNVVYDSGDLLERITAAEAPALFNNDEGDFDARSDNKGPEPEAVEFGVIAGTPYLFVALERTGGVVVFDITNPAAPVYDQWLQVPGDVAPEGLKFVSAAESPTGAPALFVSNEDSQTVTLISLTPPPATLISAIQGSGDASALVGQEVVVEAVVTRVFLDSGELGGFFIQEEAEDEDGNASTSEGLFVSAASLAPGDVTEGQTLRITGTVDERFGMTTLNLQSFVALTDSTKTGPVATDLFAVDADDRESIEAMLVDLGDVTVTETFQLGRFNEYRVSDDGLLEQYSQVTANGDLSAAGFDAFRTANDNKSVLIDDGRNIQNPSDVRIIDGTDGVLDATDGFSSGDLLTGVQGVMGFTFGEFKVQGATGGFVDANPRTPAPEVEGDLKVGALNVLNFFTTLDGNGNTTDTGESPRGADLNQPLEFDRQLDKLVAQIVAIDMDILGLVEIENTTDDRAVKALVDAINAELGASIYAFVATGLTSDQPIGNAIIYKQDVVELKYSDVLDSAAFLDPLGYGEDQSRGAVTATFEVIAGGGDGELITVSANHLKSKGSRDAVGLDIDKGDGQGAYNATRTAAAEELARWLEEDYSQNAFAAAAANTLIVGDINAYAGEDPIAVLEAAGYINTLRAEDGANAYSYVFDGEWGTLDYVLGKGDLFNDVKRDFDGFDAAVWDANSVESSVFDYDTSFKPPAQEALYSDDPYRASDHDPVLLGLNFSGPEANDDFAQIIFEQPKKRGQTKFDANDPNIVNLIANDDARAGELKIVEINGEAIKSNGNFIFDGRKKVGLVQVLDDGEVRISALGQGKNAGAFSFSYTLEDTAGDRDTATVNVDVLRKNDVFTLELLHVADQEANGASVIDAPNLAKVMNLLEAQDLGLDGIADNTLRLSSGDAIIPGLFFEASAEVFGAAGVGDIQIQNELGFDAIALGNHEFDQGTGVLAALIDGSAAGAFDANAAYAAFFAGTDLEGADYAGTMFPYLAANLDFSTDPNLSPLEAVGGRSTGLTNVVTSSSISDVNGEKIGVVGATTPTLARISSPGEVGIAPLWAGTTPTSAELDALAAEIQAEVDALLLENQGINKVILLSHMQQLNIEKELAARLEHVDIIVGGGSNSILADETDRLRDGDTADGIYPIFIENAGGTHTAVVNTDGSYNYVGRLVVDFDAAGNVIADSYDPAVSGAYATDAQGVADLASSMGVNADDFADAEIDAIANAIGASIVASESNVLGISDVFLNGRRGTSADSSPTDGVRTQETNLGNLTADANLWYAQQNFDAAKSAAGLSTTLTGADILVSLKNGGGIRDSIGEIVVPAGGTEPVRLPNSAVVDPTDGSIVKPEGGISENDIKSVLAFNNALSVFELTGAELVDVLEHGVANLGGGQTIQVSGVRFTYDDDLAPNSRIIDAAVVDDAGAVVQQLVSGGVELPSAAGFTMGVVSLGFLTGQFGFFGDGYPFPSDIDDFIFADDTAPRTGTATFAEDFSEQDALAEYLQTFHGTEATAFAEADTDKGGDRRIMEIDAVAEALSETDLAALSDMLVFG